MSVAAVPENPALSFGSGGTAHMWYIYIHVCKVPIHIKSFLKINKSGMTKAPYRKKCLFSLRFRRDGSPSWQGSGAAGRHGGQSKRQVFASSTAGRMLREQTREAGGFETTKPVPSAILPPAGVHLLNLPIQPHQSPEEPVLIQTSTWCMGIALVVLCLLSRH